MTNKQKYTALCVCCMAVLIVSIDATAVNISLPSIAKELHASTSQLQWIVDAYLMVLASLLMLSGSLADRFGQRRMFSIGISIFGLGSLLCAFSSSPNMLILMRGLQAIGGSSMGPIALSIISKVFTDKKEKAFAVGMWGTVFGVGVGLGPIVGGFVVANYNWQGIFLLNIPIIIIAVPLIHKVIPLFNDKQVRSIDVIGQILAIIFIGSLTLTIIHCGEMGFSDPVVKIAGIIALISGILFLYVENRVKEPLLEITFFKSVPFSIATLIGLIEFFSYGGFVFVASLYLQDYRLIPPMQAGFLMLPLAISNMIFAPLSGLAVGRWGTRLPMMAGATALILGASLLIIEVDIPLLYFFIAAWLIGMAMGLANSSITVIAVTGMPNHRASVAGATAATARQLGQSLGVAVLGALLNGREHAGYPFTHAATAGWYLLLILGILMVVLSWITGTAFAQRSAQRVLATF